MAMLIFTQGYVGTVLKLEPKNCQWSLLVRKPIHPWGPCSSMKPFPKWPALSLMKLLYLQTMSWVNIRESRMLLMGSQLDHLHPLKIQGWKPKMTLPFFWGGISSNYSPHFLESPTAQLYFDHLWRWWFLLVFAWITQFKQHITQIWDLANSLDIHPPILWSTLLAIKSFHI